jgi:hypothetical protein
MAARNGSPGMNGAAKGPTFSRKSFVFGLSLLAAAVFFDARPAVAQSLNLGPLQFNLGGGYYRGRGRYHGDHRGYRGRHHSYRYGYHGGGHRHHGGGGGHHGGGGGHHGGGGHAPYAPL